MWFLPGLEDRQIGWFIKVHHAMADGIAGVALLGAFIDLPTPPDEPPVWHPNPPPTRGELFRDNVNRHAASLMRMIVALLHPGRMLAQIRRYWPNLHELFFEGRAPRTSFNTRIGSRRRFGLIRGSLSAARDVAHANDGKVNDVVLAAVAEGYRALLLARGERVDGVQLNAFVPVSLHRNGDVQGNVDGGMLVPLPIGEPDPSARLRWIAVESRARKKKARPQAGAIFRSVLVQRLFLATMPRQRFMNTYVANVPGPPMFLSFVGCRITELDPIVPITANVPIGVGALSYADQLNLTVVADPDIVPDLDVFLEGVQRGLDALAAREPARA
jgi:WS/DGAT/MGAT family acyltransferase